MATGRVLRVVIILKRVLSPCSANLFSLICFHRPVPTVKCAVKHTVKCAVKHTVKCAVKHTVTRLVKYTLKYTVKYRIRHEVKNEKIEVKF